MSRTRNRARASEYRRIRRKTDPVYRMMVNWRHARHIAVRKHETMPMPTLPRTPYQ